MRVAGLKHTMQRMVRRIMGGSYPIKEIRTLAKHLKTTGFDDESASLARIATDARKTSHWEQLPLVNLALAVVDEIEKAVRQTLSSIGEQPGEVQPQTDRVAHVPADVAQLQERLDGIEQKQDLAPVQQQLDGITQMVADALCRQDANRHGRKPPDGETNRTDAKLKREATAIALRMAHPDWLDTQIAKEVGVHPGAVSRWPSYQKSKELAQSERNEVQKGHVTSDSESGLCDVEARVTPASYHEDQSDRGQQISGSRYFREYCAECKEPIAVSPGKVGKNPVCDHCGKQ